MTDAQFAALTVRLRTNGIELTGPTGTLTKDGITGNYTFANGRFDIEITNRPSFLPLSLIEGQLRAYFNQSIAAGDTPA